jgi:signal transduction histidine kinase
MVTLQEREWISAELHDGLLQTLGYLYLQADQMESLSLSKDWPEMAEKLAHQRYLLGQISADIRRFIADLRNATPPPMALEKALQKMIDEFTQKTPITVELNMIRPLQRLDADHVAHLVRIVQEALINATRHGHAYKAILTCTTVDGYGSLSIEDDGHGFAPDQVEESSEHFGLSIMRARAARLNGQLVVESRPGYGATVRVTWPLAI